VTDLPRRGWRWCLVAALVCGAGAWPLGQPLPDRSAWVVAGDLDSGNVSIATVESRFTGATEMRLGNTRGEVALAPWVPYAARRLWYLPGLNYRTVQHEVFVQFRGPSLSPVELQVPVYRADATRKATVPGFPIISVPDRRSSAFVIAHGFDNWNERWVTYQDQWGYGNVFMPMSHALSGGVRGGHIWTDASRWRVDPPEDPDSILVAMVYWRWMTAPGFVAARGFGDMVNLSDATVRVSLRGRSLSIGPARVTFWVTCDGSRWHLKRPLEVADGRWTASSVTLSTAVAEWDRSWARGGTAPAFCLDKVDSYGLAFRGIPRDFDAKGVFDVDDFSIRRGPDAPEPRPTATRSR
jgi:hypothetical protein